jgi:hypothetical protein
MQAVANEVWGCLEAAVFHAMSTLQQRPQLELRNSGGKMSPIERHTAAGGVFVSAAEMKLVDSWQMMS